MKTKMIIEVETKDEIMGKFETGDKDKPLEKSNIAEEVNNNIVNCIKKYAERWNEELPDEFDEGYIEGLELPEDYGIKISVKKVRRRRSKNGNEHL